MSKIALAAWALSLALSWRQPAYAWGDDGHRLTGHIANALLSAATRQQLQALVGTDDVAQVATWMDDEREALNERLPGSSRWHYENRSACGQTNNTAQVCPKGNCITAQIERSMRVLHNSNANVAARGEAIRILVHLLGDLHQPLHLVDNYDRGGNDLLVRLPREQEPRRLHEVWDTRLVRMNLRRTEVVSYAHTLANRFESQRASWQSGTAEQWAQETHALGRDAYQTLPRFACRIEGEHESGVTMLPSTYIETAKSVVAIQLAKAGARIAWVLNETLDATASRPVR